MRRWLVPPHRDDDYETFAVRVLHYTLLLLIAVALVFLLFVSSAVQVIFIPILILMLGGSYYLLHRGRDRLASSIFLSGL
jgi:L-asparagine transporter-like permease